MKKEIDIPWDIGDEVFVIYNGNVRRARVKEAIITIAKGYADPRLRYTFEIFSNKSPNATLIETSFTTDRLGETFKTKKEAIFKWLELNDVSPQEMLQGYFQEKKEE
jgi:hypothetical protein